MYVCAQKNERLTHLFMRIFLLVLFPDFHVVVKTNEASYVQQIGQIQYVTRYEKIDHLQDFSKI